MFIILPTPSGRIILFILFVLYVNNPLFKKKKEEDLDYLSYEILFQESSSMTSLTISKEDYYTLL